MQFTKNIALIAAMAVATQAFVVPSNAPDGLRMHTINEKGEEVTTYIGDGFNSTTVEKRSMAKRTNGVVCQGPTFTASDAVAAENGLGSQCGSFKGKLSYKSGTAVAYVCEYGNGNQCDAGSVGNYNSQIDNGCGNTVAGYYGIDPYKLSYGRTNSGEGFC